MSIINEKYAAVFEQGEGLEFSRSDCHDLRSQSHGDSLLAMMAASKEVSKMPVDRRLLWAHMREESKDVAKKVLNYIPETPIKLRHTELQEFYRFAISQVVLDHMKKSVLWDILSCISNDVAEKIPSTTKN